ncbi:MAG: glutathione S-transferase family protein, partial [Burkholderiales bacterium]
GYGTGRQLRPHWMLAEMGVNYDFERVHPRSGQTMTPEFLKINPRHKVPVLQHGDFILCESAAIIKYIGEAFEAPPHVFIPHSVEEKARVNEWCFFVLTELDGIALYVIRRHTQLAYAYGEAPQAVKAAREYFSDQFDPIVPRITQNGPCLFGERISVADILLTTVIDWAMQTEIAVPDEARSYCERMKSRAAYKRAAELALGQPQ